jgi:hypothetical protein
MFYLPIFLVAGAVDASCLIAEGIRQNRKNLTVDIVKRRLEREAIHHIRRYQYYLLILKVFIFEKPQTGIYHILIIKDPSVL